MSKIFEKRERLSIDISPEEHRRLKVYASLQGKTISAYVLEAVRERLSRENEWKELSSLSMKLETDPVLKELWDNEMDAEYDKL